MKRLLLFLLLSLSGASAATYYVDYATGSDANNGTSTSTPWKYSKGDVLATGTAASTVLVAGDRIKFKGGVTNYGQIEITNGGTAGNPIIYDGNSAGDWGTGPAVIDGGYKTNINLILLSTKVNHVTFNGLLLQRAGGYSPTHEFVTGVASPTIGNSTAAKGYGIAMWNGANTNVWVLNSQFDQLGVWFHTNASFDGGAIDGAGVVFRNSSGGGVSNCFFSRMKVGVGIQGNCQDVTVRATRICTNIVWGIDVSPVASTDIISNIVIRETMIYDYAQFNQWNWTGTGEWPHTDGVFCRDAAQGATWYPVHIFNSHWWCDDPGVSGGGTASIYVSQGASALIYNNVFSSDNQTRIIGVEHGNTSQGLQTVRIYNNTFISSQPALSFADEESGDKRAMYIENNIFRKTSGSAANSPMVTKLSGVTPVVMNRNLYYDPDWAAAAKYTIQFPGFTLFPDMNGWWGVEANAIYDNPDQVSGTASPPSSRDFHLTADSPAIGAGSDLSAFFTTDKDGNNRGSVYDIGAFEFESSSPANPAPVPGSATAITLNVTTANLNP